MALQRGRRVGAAGGIDEMIAAMIAAIDETTGAKIAGVVTTARNAATIVKTGDAVRPTAQKRMKKGDQKVQFEKKIAAYHPIRRMLLFDVISDRQSAPIFLWAGIALLIGVLAYHWLEGWTLLDSLYFCVVTLATIGYGDLTPTTPEAKIFTILYVFNGIGILLALFDRIRVVRTKEVLGTDVQTLPD